MHNVSYNHILLCVAKPGLNVCFLSVLWAGCDSYSTDNLVEPLPFRSFPHMVELGWRDPQNNDADIMWVCSGSLISEYYILTAAQCIDSGKQVIACIPTIRG